MKEKNTRPEKKNERGEENRIRAYFVRLLGRYDFRNERQFLHFGKWMLFILLLLVECLAVLQWVVGGFHVERDIHNFGVFLTVIGILTLSTALHMFAVKGKKRIVFYIVDMLAACAFLFFDNGGRAYSLVIYMLILTQFYFETTGPKYSVYLLVVSIFVYVLAYGGKIYLTMGAAEWNIFRVLNLCLGFIVGLIAHYVATQIALAFYRQYLKLHAALKELSESKKELERAYAVVEEVTILEERQRIAKEIHDTAGHSITTVIMQTEGAKRIIDGNPQEAKSKIIAANLQARNALEQLRNGVHLLSGTTESVALRDELMRVIHDSTDGTGIVIRSSIEDVEVSPARQRFLCNALKEGISNGLRHGGATAFWFEMKTEEGRISFLLSDNGRGGEKELRLGFGLTTMKERAESLGGEVSFYHDPEEGFEICITMAKEEYDED